MSQTLRGQFEDGSSSALEEWEMTDVHICILHQQEHQLEPIYAALNIPLATVGTTKTPRDVLRYLENFESYTSLLEPDYFNTFPERLPLMWPGFRDRPLSEDQDIIQLDDQIWDRALVEAFLGRAARLGEDRTLYLFHVIPHDAISSESVEDLTFGSAP